MKLIKPKRKDFHDPLKYREAEYMHNFIQGLLECHVHPKIVFDALKGAGMWNVQTFFEETDQP